MSRPPDSYLKSPDIKVGSRPTADRTAFAVDRLVPGSDTRCLCLQIVPATPSERAGNQFFCTLSKWPLEEKNAAMVTFFYLFLHTVQKINYLIKKQLIIKHCTLELEGVLHIHVSLLRTNLPL